MVKRKVVHVQKLNEDLETQNPGAPWALAQHHHHHHHPHFRANNEDNMRMRKGKGRVKGWILLQAGESEYLVRVGVSWKMAKSRATSDLMATAGGLGQMIHFGLTACLRSKCLRRQLHIYYYLGPPPPFRILVRSPRL
jgi:hypothetical protein